jgi:hypothetical protein
VGGGTSESTFRAAGRRRRAALQDVKARQWDLSEAFHLLDRAVRGPLVPQAKAAASAALAANNQEALYVLYLLLLTERGKRRRLRLATLVFEACAEAERARRANTVTAVRIILEAPPR